MYLYILILPLIFLYFAKKMYKKGNTLAAFVLLFYSIGGLLGYVMTTHELFKSSLNKGFQMVAFESVLYLAIGYLILFIPILRSNPTVRLEVNYSYKSLFIISFIFAILGVVYCIYAAPFISIALNVSDFTAYKQDILEKGGLDVSDNNRLLHLLFYLQSVLRPIISFLFCYALAKYPKKKVLIFLLAISAIMPPIFNSLAAAHRNIIVFLGLELVVGFIIFRKYYTDTIKKFFYFSAGIGGAAMLFIVVYFAILRFSQGGQGAIEYSFLRYMGEPFVNFNTMLWGTDRFMEGNKCFPIAREWMGLPVMDAWATRTFNARFVPYFFYGIIGNLYMDFGAWYSLLIIAFTAFVFNMMINRRKPRNPLSIKMMLFIYTVTTLRNYFYFDFMGGGNLRLLWLTAFFLLFQLILQPQDPEDKHRKKILLDLDDVKQETYSHPSASVPPVQGE